MLNRRQPAQSLRRSLLVVFALPRLDEPAGVAQIEEPVLVQAFVSEATVDRFNVRVLIRFARFDQPQGHVNAVSCRLRPFFAKLLVVDVDHLCIHLKRQLAAERVIHG